MPGRIKVFVRVEGLEIAILTISEKSTGISSKKKET